MSQESMVERIARDLAGLGVRCGDTLLVHSSLSSMGRVDGGPETVIRGLLQALGDEGTLLMPALSYESVSARQPLFDPLWTHSCVGVIPEYFRRRKGTLRSVHPSHSVCAVGARAAELLANHIKDTTPVGPNSPFSLLPKVGGKVLMLGCGLKPNTSMHGIEEVCEPPYLLLPDAITYVICSQTHQQVVQHRRHNFRGFAQRYDRIEQYMTQGLWRGKVLEAPCFVLDARIMWDVARKALAADQMCFVEKVA